jgi:predicted  nucleic acid-binding Zn-ribbon protein
MQNDNFSAVIEDLKNKGIQNTNKLFEDIEEQLLTNKDMVRELTEWVDKETMEKVIKDHVKTYDLDHVMSWLETQGKSIEDYK